MLCFLTLGCLLHGVMARVWSEGVLKAPNMISAADFRELVAPVMIDGDDDADNGQEADLAAEEPQPAHGQQQQQQQLQNEDEYRKARSKRAARIMRWMKDEVAQMWSTAALFVTDPIATLVGHYLQDEYMFAPSLVEHNPDALLPWAPVSRGPAERPTPTLYDFMKDDLLALRTLQSRIVRVLDLGSGPAHFLQAAFARLPPTNVYEALQHQVLETLGDLHIRFTCVYLGPACELVKMSFDDDKVPPAEKRAIGQKFLDLPECELQPLYDSKLRRFYPRLNDLLSQEFRTLIGAGAQAQKIITKAVEFIHRDNNSVARGKGPSKPSDFYTVADNYIVNRCQRFHSHALDKRCSRRDSFKFKHHPKVKLVIAKLKSLKSTGKRNGVGGNPKIHYLNRVRVQLAEQNLSKGEFYIQVAAAAARYDLDEDIRQVAEDEWRQHRCEQASDVVSAGPPEALAPQRKGPWRLGDDFWPVAEDELADFMRSHSKCGGVRPVVDAHRAWQDTHLVVNDTPDLNGLQLAPIYKTCNEKHFGLCIHKHADIKDKAIKIAAVFHSVRSATGTFKSLY